MSRKVIVPNFVDHRVTGFRFASVPKRTSANQRGADPLYHSRGVLIALAISLAFWAVSFLIVL